MNALEFKEMTKLLLLIPFGLIVITGVIFVLAAIRWARQQALQTLLSNRDPDDAHPASRGSGRQFLFSQPTRWLAIKGGNLKSVLNALGLHDPIPCSWEDGIIEARDRKIFVSPQVGGWILVVGSGLPDPGDDVDRCFHFLTHLSRKLGHVQFFSANRVLSHHSWALLDQGEVFRAYAWAGETLWNQGPLTAAERDLNLRCFEYAVNRLAGLQKEATISNTEKVNRLAARWSIDPMSIPEDVWNTEQGIVGDFSRSKPN